MKTIVFLMLASLGNAGACSADPANLLADGVEIEARSVLAALLQFGYERGVCLGIEAPGLDLLQEPVQLHFAHSTVGEVVRTLLNEKPYRISEEGRVIVIRSAESASRFTQLDATIPEFKMAPGTSLGWAEVRLFIEIRIAADPSLRSTGFAGSILGEQPEIGPIEEYERSAREILTIMASQVGGAWVSGLCPAARDLPSRPCWNVIPYGSNSELFRDLANLRVSERLAERSSLK
jgi:hypothetical protein